ncbi:type II and III secretion system protein [Sulfurimonas denitrificans DSM 1251]|uniref:Type II and III secretion system protein n=1 Tax=Sulfurimonas denitrificans (strain ATCC 33889 / DSM 1251) TaxID=326298 RepID=Q30QS0_SULDN|nr:pilus (MSHA type) biogenesis protein MshL [Sulfurimonas denitrificans]ABB44661.1 type II and III secretion system protein [Sulfurimonas denitrificans DSM 1251]MDD3442861.1 pilus (MSHA type) biogenesis protein MshL [Sulfurimonas denitrificans]
MKPVKTAIYSTLLTLLISSSVYAADCSYELFSINSKKNTKIIDFVEQLSDECNFSIIVTDPNTQNFLNTNLNKTNLNNLTIDEVLNIVLKENNLTYTLQNNLLRISYLQTKMFDIDYILSERESSSKTDITLSSDGATIYSKKGSRSSTIQKSETEEINTSGSSAGKSGMNVNSSDKVLFWHELDIEFQHVLNRPQDIYIAQPPIINKNAGIITVTATLKQMQRFEEYLKKLQDKVQLQVLIDVQLLSVTLSDGKTTGVDWSQLYNLQNMNLTFNKAKRTNVHGATWDSAYEGDTVEGLLLRDKRVEAAQSNIETYGLEDLAGVRTPVDATSKLLTISSNFTINNIIKFLKTQGDVSSISNPKVLTLNNQPALITAGTEYFYKIISDSLSTAGTGGSVTTQNQDLQSVFAGVLLDITPEISDDNMITLKINPSLSETTTDISITPGVERTMPPDLRRRQLSSVVTLRDGERIILGGLINTSNSIDVNKVPILGDIPILNYLFKYENRLKTTQELVIVIEPHIVTKRKNNLSLSELGYQTLSSDLLNSTKNGLDATTNGIREND